MIHLFGQLKRILSKKIIRHNLFNQLKSEFLFFVPLFQKNLQLLSKILQRILYRKRYPSAQGTQ